MSNKKGVTKTFVFSLLFIIILIVSLFSVTAQYDKEKVDKAYEWTENQVDTLGWDSLTLRQHTLTLLALAYNPFYRFFGVPALYDKAFTNSDGNAVCWGAPDSPIAPADESGCYILSTAMAKLALDKSYMNEDTKEIQKWLLAQSFSLSEDLHWYLQIDSADELICTIDYTIDGVTRRDIVNMNEDKTLTLESSQSGVTPYCFSLSDTEVDVGGSYWLKITRDSACLDETYFIVKCDSKNVGTLNPYSVSTFYKKQPKSKHYYLYYSAAGESGSQVQMVPLSALCFPRIAGTGISNPICDYESTGWATSVLSIQNYNTDYLRKFLPYLIAYAKDTEVSINDNWKYIPLSFLTMVSHYDYFGQALVNEQQLNVLGGRYGGTSGGFWYGQGLGGSSPYGKYYDTALAGLGLGANGASQPYSGGGEAIDNARIYLLRPDVQAIDGYWAQGSSQDKFLRDTSFILWVYFPRMFKEATDCVQAGFECFVGETCPEGYVRETESCEVGEVCCRPITSCEEAGGVCQEFPCDEDTQEEINSVLKQSCIDAGLGEYCCRDLSDCELAGGTCYDDECPPGTVEWPSLTPTCEEGQVCCGEEGGPDNPCVEHGYICREECLPNEIYIPWDCPGGLDCCGQEGIPPITSPEDTECGQMNYTCRPGFFCESGEYELYDVDCDAFGICCAPCKSIQHCANSDCSGSYVSDSLNNKGFCEYGIELTCTDSFDNDYDSLIDCNDPDCDTDPACIGENECSANGGVCCSTPSSSASHYSDYDSSCGTGEKCYSSCGNCLSEGYKCCGEDECEGHNSEYDETCGWKEYCCDSCEAAGCIRDSDCQSGYVCSASGTCVPKEKSKWWLWIILIVLIVVIAGLLYYYFVLKKKKEKKKLKGKLGGKYGMGPSGGGKQPPSRPPFMGRILPFRRKKPPTRPRPLMPMKRPVGRILPSRPISPPLIRGVPGTTTRPPMLPVMGSPVKSTIKKTTKRRVTKSKKSKPATEKELEKTFKKLKKLTK